MSRKTDNQRHQVGDRWAGAISRGLPMELWEVDGRYIRQHPTRLVLDVNLKKDPSGRTVGVFAQIKPARVNQHWDVQDGGYIVAADRGDARYVLEADKEGVRMAPRDSSLKQQWSFEQNGTLCNLAGQALTIQKAEDGHRLVRVERPEWQLEEVEGGSRLLRHLLTMKVLDVDLSSDPSGRTLHLWKKLGGNPNQLFTFCSDGYVVSVLPQLEGFALEADDSGLHMAAKSPSPLQRFSLRDGTLINDAGWEVKVSAQHVLECFQKGSVLPCETSQADDETSLSTAPAAPPQNPPQNDEDEWVKVDKPGVVLGAGAQRGRGAAKAEPGKFALVMGINTYSSGKKATGHVDSANMEKALSEVGYRVTTCDAGPAQEMLEQIEDFFKKAARCDMPVLYFSGFGGENDGRQHILGTDGKAIRVSLLLKMAAEVVPLSEAAAKEKLLIVVLDADRRASKLAAPDFVQWPLETDSTSSSTTSSSALDRPRVSFLVFNACESGGWAVEDDGPGGGGIFTNAFITHLRNRNLTVQEVLNATGEDLSFRRRGVVRQRSCSHTNAAWLLSKKSFYDRPA